RRELRRVYGLTSEAADRLVGPKPTVSSSIAKGRRADPTVLTRDLRWAVLVLLAEVHPLLVPDRRSASERYIRKRIDLLVDRLERLPAERVPVRFRKTVTYLVEARGGPARPRVAPRVAKPADV